MTTKLLETQMSPAQSPPHAAAADTLGIVLRVAILTLTLATAYIHSTFGGLMFMANALGYLVFAVLMVAPVGLVSRYRWLVRFALVGFTVVTILGWVVMGSRFDLAYVVKAIEIGLVALLLVEMWRYDGGLMNVVRRTARLGLTILRMPFSGRSHA